LEDAKSSEKMKLSPLVKSIEAGFLKKDLPLLKIGNLVTVNVFIQESTKKRLQSYQGTITSQHKAGLNSTITVDRISKGIGVARLFPIHSPEIQSIEVLPTK